MFDDWLTESVTPFPVNIGYGGSGTVLGREGNSSGSGPEMDAKSDVQSAGKEQHNIDLANFNFGAFQVNDFIHKKFFFSSLP